MRTFNIKIVSLSLCTIGLFASCAGSNNHVNARFPVKISEIVIPMAGQLNRDTEIHLKAEATNGCYENLEITMTEIDARHFLFKATVFFETFGDCPTVMVYTDTIIYFRPTLTGKYYFQTNEEPFQIIRDTLNIN